MKNYSVESISLCAVVIQMVVCCLQLKFLEVSHLSFVNGLGEKYKEGMVEKRAGGRRIALHCCSCSTCCQPGQWQERLVITSFLILFLLFS